MNESSATGPKYKKWVTVTALGLVVVAVLIVIATVLVNKQSRSSQGVIPGITPGPTAISASPIASPGASQSVKGHEVIASLSLDSADIHDLPIVRGTDQATLDTGMAGAYEWSGPGETGVFSIAAHRVGAGGPFLNLNHAHKGDVISVVASDGTYKYRVTSVKEVSPNDTSVLKNAGDKAEIALITCTPISTFAKRLVVTGLLIK